MFRVLILTAAFVVSSLSYGKGSLNIIERLASYSMYDRAARLAQVMSIPLYEIASRTEVGKFGLEKIGEKMGMTYEEIETATGDRVQFLALLTEAQMIINNLKEAVEERGMKLTRERVDHILSYVGTNVKEYTLHERTLKELTDYLLDNMVVEGDAQ